MDLVVLGSTTYPGTTEEVVGTPLEASGLRVGDELLLASRRSGSIPATPTSVCATRPRLWGASSGGGPALGRPSSSTHMCVILVIFEAKGSREAELAKLLENTYRHVNIAPDE